jgi:hypothetical protein
MCFQFMCPACCTNRLFVRVDYATLVAGLQAASWMYRQLQEFNMFDSCNWTTNMSSKCEFICFTIYNRLHKPSWTNMWRSYNALCYVNATYAWPLIERWVGASWGWAVTTRRAASLYFRITNRVLLSAETNSFYVMLERKVTWNVVARVTSEAA